MNIAVRYCSRSGNTKMVAEAIAKAARVPAVSITEEGAAITEPVDVLFIGGALYAYGLDKRLKAYLEALPKDTIKKAVVFSTSAISKHSIDLIKKGLADKGIPVEEDAFYVKSKPGSSQLAAAEVFARQYI